MTRRPDFGGILGETIDIFRDGFRFVAIYVLLVGGLGGFGVGLGLIEPTNNIVSLGGGVSGDQNTTIASAFFQVIVAVISVVGAYLLLSKLLEIRGRLAEGGTRIWAYFGMSILFVLGLIGGFMLLIIPGIILLVRWSASSGYLIGSREGITEALGKSFEATKGHSWPIFFAGLVMLIAVGAIGGVIGGFVGGAGGSQFIGVASAFAEAFGNGVSYCFGIAVYCLVDDSVESTTDVFE